MATSNIRTYIFFGAFIALGSFTYGAFHALHKPADPAHIREILTSSSEASCAKEMHKDPRVSKLSSSTIDSYCSCTTTKAIAQYTDAELITRDKQEVEFTPADKARFVGAAESCIQVITQNNSAQK